MSVERKSRPIRIFVDCHVFDDGFQGTTTYLKGLYSELTKDEGKHFFLASNNIENLQAIFGKKANIVYLKYRFHNKFLRLLIDIPRLIKANGIDFAHFQYIVSPIKRCKYIVTTHDVLFIDFPEYFPTLNRIKNQFFYKWSIKYSDIVLTVSEYSKKQINKHFGIDEIYITTNAVSEEFFEAYDKREVQKYIKEKYDISKYIIFVSRWEPRKKHDLVLKSFVKLQLYKEYKLVFIGETTFENKIYKEYFNNLEPEIQDKVYNFKRVDFREMLQFLRGAEVSVYPSVAEGFGIPPLESLAAGIRTITSNTTAMSDFKFLEPYSFDPMDQGDFEEKLLKALQIEDSEMLLLMEALKTRYSWKKAATVLGNIVEQKKGLE